MKTAAKMKVTNSGKEECKNDHLDVENFKEETDKRYCKENMDLDGVVCASCKIKFGDTDELGVAVPSVKYLIYVCSGRTLHECLYSLCNPCYAEKSSEGIGKRKRPRRG